MTTVASNDALVGVGAPMANYAAAKRVGDFVFMSGVVAFDGSRKQAVASYDDIPPLARDLLKPLGYVTGQVSVDVFEAPIVAQSWFVLDRIRQLAEQHGGTMADVFKLVQYFRDLRHYPSFNRVRGLFYPEAPPVSTVVEVSRFLPGDGLLVEVEATAYLPILAR
jgi:2-iminobutanoate/2-iminopropanoate deaminase